MSEPTKCKDCRSEGVTTTRKPAVTKTGDPVPGNRCVTHHRAFRKATRQRSAERRVERVYNITATQYARLYAAQGSRCYFCHRANGATRRLSVDHDHKTGIVRGLLCRPCNDLLGHMRDDPAFPLRVSEYLAYPQGFATHIFGEPIYASEQANERRGTR